MAHLIRGRNRWVLVEDGLIAATALRAEAPEPPAAQVSDYPDAELIPGLIDIHVHGGAGYDFMRADTAGLAAIHAHLRRHGVTTWLATTVSAPWDFTVAAVTRLAAAGELIHLEGPWLSPEYAGVHRHCDLRLPRLADWRLLWERSQGRIRMLTIAPELEGAEELIRAAAAQGVVVSLGHTNASAAQARAAIAWGARHATHTFNAMRPLTHRDPPLLAEVLANPALTAEIIADGIHVDPAVVELFCKLKGPDHAILVSDAISATGQGNGRFQLGNLEVDVQDGRCTCGHLLAGSVLTLDQALRNLAHWTGQPWQHFLPAATRNPARLLELPSGRLEECTDANLAVIDPRGQVVATYVAELHDDSVYD